MLPSRDTPGDASAVEAAFDRALEHAARQPWRPERRSEALLKHGVPTFAESVRIKPQDATGYDAVVYGIPFEGLVVKDPRTFYPQGTGPAPGADVYSRPGAFEAPDAIRRASLFYSLDHSGGLSPEHGLALADHVRLADAGDADLGDQEPEQLLRWVPDEIEQIVQAGSVPLVIGGDHLVPIFPLTALHRGGRRLGVIVYDSHFDLSWEPRYWAGSQWARAMELGVLDPRNLVLIGIRGLRNSIAWQAAARELGVSFYTIADVEREGLPAITAKALAHALDGVDELYVSVDVDAFDPAAVPAQKYPEPGGLSAREVVYSLRQVLAQDAPLAGFDFCCLGPAYDHQHTGSAVAARCFVEVLAGLAERKRRA